MKLERIGIELELTVGRYRDYFDRTINGYLGKYRCAIRETSRGNLETDGFVTLDCGLKAQLTDEYYNSQCEWKLFPAPLSEIDKMKNLIVDITDNTDGSLVHESMPAFVGTHIHLFFKENKKDIETFYRGKTILSAFLMEYFYYFFKEATHIPTSIRIKELERLSFNHNILQKLDYKVLNKGIRNNLNSKGFDYYYTNLPKPKYQPVHWSNPSNGKPLTLELRFIPNSFIYYSSADTIKNFLTTIEDKVGYINSLEPEEFKQEYHRNIQQCIFWHEKLLSAYLYFMRNSDVSHLPRGSSSSSTPRTFKFDDNRYNFIMEYTMRRKAGANHKDAFRNSRHNTIRHLYNFLDSSNSVVASEEELSRILSMTYFQNKEQLMDKYRPLLIKNPEDKCKFPLKCIKDITISKTKEYPIYCSPIDSEGDELIPVQDINITRPDISSINAVQEPSPFGTSMADAMRETRTQILERSLNEAAIRHSHSGWIPDSLLELVTTQSRDVQTSAIDMAGLEEHMRSISSNISFNTP